MISSFTIGKEPYQAEWIWKEGVTSPNTWMAFRKEITLNESTKNALATIAVDSKYWLWINDELIIREGGVKRTPNPHDTYADTVELSNYLKKGKNTIAILVWYWGKAGHGHYNSGQGGLFFQMNVGKQMIKSDNTWKVLEHPAFDKTLTGPQPYRPLSEFNIAFDARKDVEEWYKTSFDDRAWSHAKTLGIPPVKPWGNLVMRQIPQWKDFGLKDYENSFAENSLGNILVMKMPYNAQITPYFKIKAPAGLLIDVRTDKYTDGGAYNVRAEYITKEGIQEYESPGWQSGDQVWYNFPHGVEILELKYRESGYDASFEGAFSCDDEFYNKLWEKARRTLYVNMRDNFMDCPTRERAMWWGDVVHESLQSYYIFSSDVHNLTKKAIEELMAWQTDEGVLYSPIPGPHPPLPFGPHRELPLQSLAAISHFSLGSYYMFTGDRQTLIDAYPAIKKYLSLWEIGDNGLVIHRSGKWDWQDWGKNQDAPLLDNAWYYSALEAAKDIAVLSGNYADTVWYHNHMKSIRDNFDKTFWNGKGYRSTRHNGEHLDDRGNAMAILTGLAGKERWKDLSKLLSEEHHAGPYMEKFVLEALFKIGATDLALDRMKNRYSEMVDSDHTTLWEVWERSLNQSVNHGWTGGPLALMMQYVVGVSPIEPTLKSFSVAPQLGKLNEVNSRIPTKYGAIDVYLKKNAESFLMNLSFPADIEAVVDLPTEDFPGKTTFVNGMEINDKFLKNNKHIQRIDRDGKTLYKIKGSQKWEISIN